MAIAFFWIGLVLGGFIGWGVQICPRCGRGMDLSPRTAKEGPS